MDSHDHTKLTVRLVCYLSQEFQKAFVGYLAQLFNGMSKAWGYLLLYNIMFIMPLVTIFILTYIGLRTQTLLDWSKRNVVVSKIMLGCLFLILASLMIIL